MLARCACLAFGAMLLLSGVGVSAAAPAALVFDATKADLEGDGPVLGRHAPGERWTAESLVVDLDARKLTATYTNGIGGTMAIDGAFDPTTWALNATVRGNESYGDPDGDVYRRSTYTGTIHATMFEGGTATGPDELSDSVIPQVRASGGPRHVNLLWYGTSTVTFTSYEERPPNDERNYSQGQEYSGEMRLQLSGEISAPDVGPPLRGQVVAVEGDVERLLVGQDEAYPIVAGLSVGPGDVVTTGPEGSITLDFGYATLVVPPLTSFRVDESVQEESIHRTQLFLNAGSVRATIHQPASVRGDFSVATPGANAAIRGSSMVVSYDADADATRVFVLEDEAFVSTGGSADEVRVGQGQSIAVDNDGVVGEPIAYAQTELPSGLAVEEVPLGGGSGGAGRDEGGNGAPSPSAVVAAGTIGIAAMAARRARRAL